MKIFNHKPTLTQNIFHQILKYSSEDRNHVTIMFQLYPNIYTAQSLNSIVYTNVPIKLKYYLSQRKRWNLGAISNDFLLLFNKRHNLIERIQSFINILIQLITPFIFIATIEFGISIIKNPSLLMLYLSIFMIIPIIYNLLIPFIKYKKIKKIYYYPSYLIYLTCSPFLSIMTYLYTIFNMDNFSWNIYSQQN